MVQDAFAGLCFPSNPEGLYEPLDYFMGLGGKRLRPTLCLIACNMYDEKALPMALKPAMGIELFHNFTLIHDDVMDRSAVRRGHPCVHVKWNENTAILSGDALQIMAYQYMQEAPSDKLRPCLDVFCKAAMEVCEGQSYDMLFESKEMVDKADYLEMIRLKTAVLLACSLKIGGIIADAPEADWELLYQFGIHIGMAFQIQDDLLDVYGDTQVFGKAIGGDIACNKKTFLWIYAMEKADEETKTLLLGYFNNQYLERDEKFALVTDIYNRLGVREDCENQIAYHQQQAFSMLHALSVQPSALTDLIALAETLKNRQV